MMSKNRKYAAKQLIISYTRGELYGYNGQKKCINKRIIVIKRFKLTESLRMNTNDLVSKMNQVIKIM